MSRPDFTDEEALKQAVTRAKDGDRIALEQVVSAVQDDVYRLASRMAAHPEDAEDASQEILVKVITRLDGFRGDSSVRTWAYRIAVRHLLDRRKSRTEMLALTFERFGADLLDGLAAEPDPDPLLAEEVKHGCTLAMLTCLDREHRLAYVLGDVFDLPHQSAAALTEVTEDTHRQRLSRARRALEAFTTSFCGLVKLDAPCLCSKRVVRAAELGRIQRGQRLPPASLLTAKQEMESLHATATLLRSHPEHKAPERILERVRAVVNRM